MKVYFIRKGVSNSSWQIVRVINIILKKKRPFFKLPITVPSSGYSNKLV